MSKANTTLSITTFDTSSPFQKIETMPSRRVSSNDPYSKLNLYCSENS